MELMLNRQYFKGGTNGVLSCGGKTVCTTIELPWKDNQPRISCIPEGSYRLRKRHSRKFRSHLMLLNVPDRSLILIHPANHAATELFGCIAPVTAIAGEGSGTASRQAFRVLKDLVTKALDRGEDVVLTIKSSAS